MTTLTALAYLLASSLFIVGLKLLSSPRTARLGNLLGAVGMLVAIVVTLLDRQIVSYGAIVAGLAVGSIVGAILAVRIQLTSMPQMVGVLNGFGGAASTLVAGAEYLRLGRVGAAAASPDVLATLVLSLLIGMVTFLGSMIAAAKLQGLIASAPVRYPFQKAINACLLLAVLFVGTWFCLQPQHELLVVVLALSTVLGVTAVIPIGGADMPVVISLLNSYSGLAGAMTGFVLRNEVLIISGTLVGASGIILTQIMCKAMNRSLANVLFAGVGGESAGPASADGDQRTVVRYTPTDAAFMLENARSVVIIPGYGLAVAQAQHVLQELVDTLTARGIEVRYAIHPVAGRMPGHMNVLLAEANAPYETLLELEQINEDFPTTDVVLVVGANDVVNPAARTRKESPLYGMPILNADFARTVIVLKRSLKPGFAGEDNDLFYDRKTMMVLGDAKATITELLRLVKAA